MTKYVHIESGQEDHVDIYASCLHEAKLKSRYFRKSLNSSVELQSKSGSTFCFQESVARPWWSNSPQ
jgi:hypothetical protein